MKVHGDSFLRSASPLKWNRPQGSAGEATPKLPSDQVEIRSTRSGAGRVGLWAGVGLMGAVVAASVLLTPGPGITVDQLGRNLSLQTAQQDQGSSMRFEVVPNAAGKIDLVRQQDSEDDGDGGSRSVNRPLSPMGVYVGDGIFLDSNMNLSFVPSRLLHGPVLEPGASMRVTGTQQATISQHGDTTNIERFGADQSVRQVNPNRVEFRAGSWSSPVQISRSGDTTSIEGGAFYYPVTITRSGDQVKVRQSGLFGSGVETLIARQGNSLEVSRQTFLGGKVNISANGDGQVQYSGRGVSDTLVQRGENGIVTRHGDFLSSHSTLNLRGNSFQETGPNGHFRYEIRNGHTGR